MRAVGIIAEYNPFHRGHQYHIEEARRVTGADAVVVVLSGNFVQRGEPAIVDKYRRTAMALAGGADVVLELPVSWATGTAERFAVGGVRILHALGPVTDLVCGSESPDPALWDRIIRLLREPTAAYTEHLRQLLKKGMTYPAARAAAVEACLPGAGPLLSSPNNILALEYRRAMADIPGGRLTPHEILRVGSSYGDTSLPEDTAAMPFPSATAIRRARLTGEDIPETAMPAQALSHLDYAIAPDVLSSRLRHTLLMTTAETLAGYQDMNEDLANRLLGIFREHPEYTYTQFAEALKSRNITRTRSQRALLHTILQMKEEASFPSAVRLLGFRPGTPILRSIMDQTELPIITKMADAPAGIFHQDLIASHLYNQLVYENTGILLPDEFRRGPVR